MTRDQPRSTSDKIGDVLFTGFGLLVAAVILYSCIDQNTRWFKPDYSQPHEYLKVTGYGLNGETMEGNDHWYFGTGLTEYKDNFFPIGKGECTEYLEKISPDRAKLSMRAFNSFLSDEGDHNDIRVAHVKLQCIEFLGRDKSCEDRLRGLAKETRDPRAFMLIIAELSARCDRRQEIGRQRVISLRE